MEMVVPTLQQAGTYYLWPGLQDVGTTGNAQSISNSLPKLIILCRCLPRSSRRQIRNLVDWGRLVLQVRINSKYAGR